MLIKEMKKILQDQAHIFQDTYFESSQILQLTIMHSFEHTSQDVLFLSFISKSLETFLACA